MGFLKRFKDALEDSQDPNEWVCIKIKSENKKHNQLIRAILAESKRADYQVYTDSKRLNEQMFIPLINIETKNEEATQYRRTISEEETTFNDSEQRTSTEQDKESIFSMLG